VRFPGKLSLYETRWAWGPRIGCLAPGALCRRSVLAWCVPPRRGCDITGVGGGLRGCEACVVRWVSGMRRHGRAPDPALLARRRRRAQCGCRIMRGRKTCTAQARANAACRRFQPLYNVLSCDIRVCLCFDYPRILTALQPSHCPSAHPHSTMACL